MEIFEQKKKHQQAKDTEEKDKVLNDHHAKMKILADRARQRIKDRYGSNENIQTTVPTKESDPEL